MDRFVITGKKRLEGDIKISGSKNAVLPILAACLLTKQTCTLHNVPILDDVAVMCEVLQNYGVKVEWEGHTISINAAEAGSGPISAQLTKKMRASSLVLGPLLSRFQEVMLPISGGCAIGSRPINYHLQALNCLGAQVSAKGDSNEAKATRLKGAEVHLDFPSVGATENTMMAAVLAEGDTTIYNAAKEPELIDLANFLNCLGAKINGAGSNTIRVEGVAELGGTEYWVMPDRIEAGTMLCAAAITDGDIYLRGAKEYYLTVFLNKMREAGAVIMGDAQGLRISAAGCLHGINIYTMPYPGFPTDMQPQMMALLTQAHGVSVISENIFEKRFRQVEGLCALGADIKVLGRTAIISGKKPLLGTEVEATDLRAGAALVLAALAAEGVTTVQDIKYIDRGYERFEENLAALGADIVRTNIDIPIFKTEEFKTEEVEYVLNL